MDTTITQYYIDLISRQNFLLFRREDGTLVLMERNQPLTLLDALPPNAHPYEKQASVPSRLEMWWKGIKEDRATYLPSPEHLAEPVALYHSETDSILVLGAGAVVFLSAGTIRFYTHGQAETAKLTTADLDANPAYTRLSAEPVADYTVHPVEPCYIVCPGLDEREGTADGMRSIDFTLDESNDYSESGRAFLDIAKDFAALTGSTVDLAAWDTLWQSTAAGAVIPFRKDGATIADLQMRGYNDLPEQDYYHDSLCISLRYSPVLQDAVRQLIRNILATHRHVRVVPARDTVPLYQKR